MLVGVYVCTRLLVYVCLHLFGYLFIWVLKFVKTLEGFLFWTQCIGLHLKSSRFHRLRHSSFFFFFFWNEVPSCFYLVAKKLKWINSKFKLSLAPIHDHKQSCFTNSQIKSTCFNIFLDILVTTELLYAKCSCPLKNVFCFTSCVFLLWKVEIVVWKDWENIYFSEFGSFEQGGRVIIWNVRTMEFTSSRLSKTT